MKLNSKKYLFTFIFAAMSLSSVSAWATLEDAGKKADEAVQDIKDKAKEKTDDAKDKAQKLKDDAKDKAHDIINKS